MYLLVSLMELNLNIITVAESENAGNKYDKTITR